MHDGHWLVADFEPAFSRLLACEGFQCCLRRYFLYMVGDMQRFLWCLCSLGFWSTAGRLEAQAPSSAPTILERTARLHPMRYFLSLPEGWNPQRTWPVVVVVPDAFREFQETAKEFSDARGSLPFVIVVPLVLSGGGTAQQHKTDFDYSDSAWSLATKAGNCRFDEDGLTAVLKEVRALYNTDSQFFITGWEAGAHVAIAQLFQHPGRIRAVAVVTPNFIGRCVTPPTSGLADQESVIPVRVFHGENDPVWTKGNPLFATWPRLDSAARSRGFRNVRDTLVKNGGHGPLAAETLNYFGSFLNR